MSDRPDHGVRTPELSAPALEGVDLTPFLRALTEQSSLVLFVTLLDPPRIVYLSGAFERVWRRPVAEALADPDVWLRSIHEEDRASVVADIHAIRRDPYPFDLRYRIVRPDGGVRHIRDRMIAGGEGKDYIVGIAEDVTDTHHSGALLWAQRRCLEDIARGEPLVSSLGALTRSIEALTQNSRASILLLDPATLCVRHLTAPSLPEGYTRAIDGFPIGPVAGSCGTAMHRGSRVIVSDIETDPLWAQFRDTARAHGLVACWSEPILARDHRALGSFALYPDERRGPTDDESDLLTAAAHLAAIAIERDESTRALEARVRDRTKELHVAHDRLLREVEERHRIEDAARKHEAELTQALRFATLGEMASAIAHELNQPLAAISNFASGAALRLRHQELSSNDLAHVLREIDSLARRGGAIIRRVRGLVQARTPRGGVADPAESIRRAWRLVESEATRTGVTMTLDLDRAPSAASIDPVQLEQVVINLVRNAIEELAECPSQRRDLILRAEPLDVGGAAIEILDSGRGLSIDDGALFEPFITSKPDGMGLGLAISRSIIESSGGRLLWKPNHPHGSCFRLELPERWASRKGAAP